MEGVKAKSARLVGGSLGNAIGKMDDPYVYLIRSIPWGELYIFMETFDIPLDAGIS